MLLLLFYLYFCIYADVAAIVGPTGGFCKRLINIGNIVVITASARAFLAFSTGSCWTAILPLLLPLNGHVNI